MGRLMLCKGIAASLLVLLASSAFAGDLAGKIAAKYRVLKTDEWFGGRRTVFDFDGYNAWVVEPPADVAAKDGTIQAKRIAPAPNGARIAFEVPTSGGTIVMTDYASADCWDGSHVRTWLSVPASVAAAAKTDDR